MRTLLAAPDAPVDEALLRGCVPVLRDWGWAERPFAVTWIPSRSRPQLVESLARGLASMGRMVDLGPMELVDGGPIGDRGGNSAYRLAGVWDRVQAGAMVRDQLELSPGAVLLVDDLVDSRWTMTVAGRALREAGATSVLPFALAVSG